MNGVEKALLGLNVSDGEGVEIGPLAKPLVSKSDGRVFYMDRCSTKELRENFAPQGIDVSKIVDVDFIWGEKTLAECVASRQFDYCIASHVVEHIPDLIGWLNEVSSILKPGGILSLVLPDRRFSFDILRSETRHFGTAIAHLFRLRKPAPWQVYDHFSHFVGDVDAGAIWAGIKRPYKRSIGRFAAARISTGALRAYIDAHCWVFTPTSFVRLIDGFMSKGLIDLEIDRLFATEPGSAEFFATLIKR